MIKTLLSLLNPASKSDDAMEQAVEEWKASTNNIRIHSLIEQRLREELRNHRAKIHDSLKNGSCSPSALAIVAQFVNTIAGNALESGRFHFYRGQMTEDGIFMMAAYSTTWNTMVEMGLTTAENAQAEIRHMREVLRMSG